MRHAEQQIKRRMAAHTAVALVMQAAKRAGRPTGTAAGAARCVCLFSLSKRRSKRRTLSSN